MPRARGVGALSQTQSRSTRQSRARAFRKYSWGLSRRPNRYLGIRCLGLLGYNVRCEGIAVTVALFSASLGPGSDLRSAAPTPRVATPSHRIVIGAAQLPKLQGRGIDAKPPKSPYNGRLSVSVAGRDAD